MNLLRLSAASVFSCISTSLILTSAQVASAQDYASFTLSPGFQPDPVIGTGTAGGTEWTDDCGYLDTANAPDHVLTLTNDFSYLRANVNSSADVSLVVVNQSTGNRICVDDSNGTLLPEYATAWPAGTYHIWVGDWDNGSNRYELSLTAANPNNSAASNTPPAQLSGGTSTATGTESNAMVADILAAHNRYRDEYNLPHLTWSDTVAASAQQWANQLASSNTFEHSAGSGYGENLWRGTAGAYSTTQMVDSWGSEKQYFIPNRTFPDLSTTGNWADVGHYTQIIWRNTTEVGCALATGSGSDVLVCQYNPPGNYTGQNPY